jgi:hypothetical protein
MRGGNLGLIMITSLMVLTCIPINVEAHTPSIITSNLSENGPIPSNITETTDFFEGDSVYFRMGDKGENVTMRVSIDIDGDGVFNQSTDVFSNWLNFSCELNENGTEVLDENCSISFTYQFSANNSTGTYYYQVERRIEENYTNSWINTIYVGIDIHLEDGVPNIGDCFGAGCAERTENLVDSKSDGFEIGLVEIIMIISAIGVIGLSISIIKENKQVEDKTYSQSSIWDQYSEE